jgi:hypothetical protein
MKFGGSIFSYRKDTIMSERKEELINSISKLEPETALDLLQIIPNPVARDLLREWYACKKNWQWRGERHYYHNIEHRVRFWRDAFTIPDNPYLVHRLLG